MNKNLRQTTKQYTLNLILPKEINLVLVDNWLQEVFEIEVGLCSGDEIHQLVYKAQLIIKALLQSVLIPVYYDGEILSIIQEGEDRSKFIVTMRVAYVHFIADKHYTDIINFSFKALFWMMLHLVTAQTKEILFKSCLDEIINPILPLMPVGKSRIPVLKAAYERDIPFIHLGNGVYQLGWGSKSKKMDRSTIDKDSAMGSMLSQNKVLSANLVRMAGLPAPLHGVARNEEEAKAIANQITYPVVVKPADLDRGEGVYININNENQLLGAFLEAFKLSRSKEILVERQVQGVCHRLFVAHEKLLYAVKRLPISIKANGIDTIETLIKKSNGLENKKAPWLREKQVPMDEMAYKELQKIGFDFNSIPPKDMWIPLRDIESTKWGGRDEDVTHNIHPDNVAVALNAAKLFGLGVAGVDIITTDISKPWYETGAILNEINFAPSFGLAEISKSRIPAFFDDFLEKDGRVPLEIFVGDDEKTLSKAKQKQKKLKKEGQNCYLATFDGIEDENGSKVYTSIKGLFQNIQSLFLNSRVDAIVAVVSNDEFLYYQLPFDKVHSVTIVSAKIKKLFSKDDQYISNEEFEKLKKFLRYPSAFE